MSTEEQVFSDYAYYCYAYANIISPVNIDDFLYTQCRISNDGQTRTFIHWTHPSTPPTLSDLMLITNETMIAHKYYDMRRKCYPSISDQLDMLYHDITGGTGIENGSWISCIHEVKERYPKPT